MQEKLVEANAVLPFSESMRPRGKVQKVRDHQLGRGRRSAPAPFAFQT